MQDRKLKTPGGNHYGLTVTKAQKLTLRIKRTQPVQVVYAVTGNMYIANFLADLPERITLPLRRSFTVNAPVQ